MLPKFSGGILIVYFLGFRAELFSFEGSRVISMCGNTRAFPMKLENYYPLSPTEKIGAQIY